MLRQSRQGQARTVAARYVLLRWCAVWQSGMGEAFGVRLVRFRSGTAVLAWLVRVMYGKVRFCVVRSGSPGKSGKVMVRCVLVSSGKHVNDNNERRQYGGI